MPSLLASEYELALGSNQGLAQTVYEHAQATPQKTAVVDGDSILTYGQLHIKSWYLSQRLLELSVSKEETVGVVVQHGVNDAIAQLSVLYGGCTCVPMDPNLPDNQIIDRLKRLGTRCVLTDNNNLHRDLGLHAVNVDDTPNTQSTSLDALRPVTSDLSHCSHLIHTSGTTSLPKAVRLSASSILHIAYHAPFDPIQADDVVAHSNRSSFDVSLFDIWAPLLRGASIAVLSKAALLDSPLLASEIDRMGITVMIFPAPLLNLAATTYPKAFAKVRRCIMGGEAANAQALRTIFKHGRPELIVNAYGPTECCAYCLAHEITPEDVQEDSISIGRPIGNNIAYVADETGNASNEGELWIGGPGVTTGYVNQPKKNATAFTMVPGIVNEEGIPVRFYRTGDMVRRLPDGRIDFIGRQDHQVQIQGFRIELGAVENALLRTGLFSEAAALRVEPPFSGSGAILAAFAVPTDSEDPPEMDEAINSLKTFLPGYMIPQLEVISKMPLNNHFKVDRKRLEKLFSQRWNLAPAAPAPVDLTDMKDIQSGLAGIWSQILALPISASNDSDDFFKLGGNSLQAALLISQIRRTFQVEASLLTLYDHSSLKALTSVISESVGGRFETVRDESAVLIADSKVADDLVCPEGPVVDWRSDLEGRVFVTGATGFVGAFFIADLLASPQVHQVGCLIRADSIKKGIQRIKATLLKYNLWQEQFAEKIIALPGVLEDESLGLGERRFQAVAHWASVVFHLGAKVNYTQPYSMHKPANTMGTKHVVRLACIGRKKAVHYISSISCFGPTGYVNGATTVTEDEALLPHLPALKFDHGYAQSQWVADELMKHLMDRGFPIAIYRPGFVTGHSKTGVLNPDDFFSRLIHACQEMGCYPSLPNQRKEFVPVDYVSAIMLHISASPASIGHAFHIVPPSRNESLDIEDSMKLVGEAGGFTMQLVPYAEWVDRLAATSPERLQPLQPMLAEKVQGKLTRWELYEKMPTYDTANTTAFLADYPGGMHFPSLDAELMTKYLEYLGAK